MNNGINKIDGDKWFVIGVFDPSKVSSTMREKYKSEGCILLYEQGMLYVFKERISKDA